MLGSPLFDAAVITAEQHFGNPPSLEVGGSRVDRLLQEPTPERLLGGRLRIAHHSGEESGDTFDGSCNRHLPTGEHVVPETHLLVDVMVYDPLVHALEPATQEGELGSSRPIVERRLGQLLARGREEHPVRPGEGLQGCGQGLDHHHHPRATAKGSIVELFVTPDSVLPEIDDVHGEHTIFDGAADDGRAQRPVEVVREHGEHVDLHPGEGRGTAQFDCQHHLGVPILFEMRQVATGVLAVLLAACAGNGVGASTTTMGVPTTAEPTTTLPPVVECPGTGEFEEGGGIADIDGAESDSRTIGRISWEVSDQCESFRFEFETSEGAPATTVPSVTIDHLESFQVIRIAMEVESTVLTDQLVETDLVDRLYVVRALDGAMFVDLHLSQPAAARASAQSSPAALTLDLKPGFVPFEGEASVGDRVVVVSPTAESEVDRLVQMMGYSRTFDGNVLFLVTTDGETVLETTTTAADYITTWGEFRAETILPAGRSSVFVGEASPEDGTLEGVIIDLTAD